LRLLSHRLYARYVEDLLARAVSHRVQRALVPRTALRICAQRDNSCTQLRGVPMH
jgi:hypothetical protein